MLEEEAACIKLEDIKSRINQHELEVEKGRMDLINLENKISLEDDDDKVKKYSLEYNRVEFLITQSHQKISVLNKQYNNLILADLACSRKTSRSEMSNVLSEVNYECTQLVKDLKDGQQVLDSLRELLFSSATKHNYDILIKAYESQVKHVSILRNRYIKLLNQKHLL